MLRALATSQSLLYSLRNKKPSFFACTLVAKFHRNPFCATKFDEDRALDSESIYSNGSEEGDSSFTKDIVSPLGDNSPALSPLLILPAPTRPIFPGYIHSLFLKDQASIDNILENKDNISSKYIGVFLRKNNGSSVSLPSEQSDIISDVSQIYNVGTFAEIQKVVRIDQGAHLLLYGHRRITLQAIDKYGPPTIASVHHWIRASSQKPTDRIKAFMNEILLTARDLIKHSPLLQEQFQLQLHKWISHVDMNDPYKLADIATVLAAADGWEMQRILEAENIEERLSLVLDVLVKERELAKLQKEINKQVEEKVSKQQREYFLREQLKNIKRELGMEKDDKEDLVAKYHEHIKAMMARQVSKSTISTIAEELKKLESLEKTSSEFNTTRSYLDWLVSIPWGKLSNDVLNLKIAKKVLDEDHYGLEDIKTRILEFIAVGKLRGSVSGKIVCFVGPPGVGKTSIAKSIANSLDKKFFRFSVGGLTDTAEIKGHRRTYIGAMPGKPVQCLKSTGVMNPLILIDEIDKLGRSYNGDPASALLELLDPNQNASFVDHYLDVPTDFSDVLFVCTANDTSTIPGPLQDRMEIIRLSGYDIKEKLTIASRYLVPKALREAGLVKENDDPNKFTITDKALELLIKNYCRESGVRSLEKMIEKIARKVAFQRVDESEKDDTATRATTTVAAEEESSSTIATERVVIGPNEVEKYAGEPLFTDDIIYESASGPLPPGIVMGLAWNPLGGSALFIETASTPSPINGPVKYGKVSKVTGQLGSVMRESVDIAYTFSKKFVAKLDKKSEFFSNHELHVHFPEGAISKDGPSAGIAIATSFISLAINRAVNPTVAMTGELSLTGKVLPVGGIKEKILAAKRSGARTIILPFPNKRHFDELPEYVKEDLQVHFAKTYDDVHKIAFGAIKIKRRNY